MIDTARHFISPSNLMKIIDGMEAVKLNVLHVHWTDSESFPLYITSEPELTRTTAYS